MTGKNSLVSEVNKLLTTYLDNIDEEDKLSVEGYNKMVEAFASVPPDMRADTFIVFLRSLDMAGIQYNKEQFQ